MSLLSGCGNSSLVGMACDALFCLLLPRGVGRCKIAGVDLSLLFCMSVSVSPALSFCEPVAELAGFRRHNKNPTTITAAHSPAMATG